MQVAQVKKFLTIHHFVEVGVGVPFFNFKIMKPDTNYVLDQVDKDRIQPLLDEIFDSNIKFTYLITMTYPYRITDYTEVMKHNRHKLYVLKKNLKQSIKSFTTIEKHKSAKNILDPSDQNIYVDDYYDAQGKIISRYGSLHTHTLIDARNTTKTKIRNLIRTYCPQEYNNQFGGFDIRNVNDKVNILSYMTKDINAPDLINLNIERHHVIDSVNSDIGKDHPSVRGANGKKRISKRSSRLLLSPSKKQKYQRLVAIYQ